MPRTNRSIALPPRAGAVLAAVLAAAVLSGALGACGSAEAPPQMPPPEVAALQIQPGAMPLDLEYAARLRGAREVEVRARVSGILLERRYEEGAAVKEGELLFRIDPAPFRATVARARGDLNVRRAELAQATRERDRIVPLQERGVLSARERDAAIAAFETARAAAEAAEAQLRTAELDLSYTEVRAPISGLTSREARSEGSLVTAGTDSSLLTSIVQADRLYVEFAMPADQAARVRRALAQRGEDALRVDLVAPDGGVVARGARIEFVAPRVGDETGTVGVRAVLDNREQALLPGQVARARLAGVTLPDVIAIPKRAVMRGQDGTFVWVVGDDGTAQPRPVKLGASNGNFVVVADGLQAGDRAIVDGVLKVQPGVPVRAVAYVPPGQAAETQAASATGAGAPAAAPASAAAPPPPVAAESRRGGAARAAETREGRT
jgi:membrane fusion protein, multidrug efflux system